MKTGSRWLSSTFFWGAAFGLAGPALGSDCVDGCTATEKMHRCIRGLKIALMPDQTRQSFLQEQARYQKENLELENGFASHQNVPLKDELGRWERKQMESAADFFPGQLQGRDGFFGVQGSRSFFFEIPKEANAVVDGKPKYNLQLRIPPDKIVVAKKVGLGGRIQEIFSKDSSSKTEREYRAVMSQARIDSGIGYAYFSVEPGTRKIDLKTLSMLTDTDQKGDLDRLLRGKNATERERLGSKRKPPVATEIESHLAIGLGAESQISGYIVDLMEAKDPPAYQDFLRGFDTEPDISFKNYVPNAVKKFPTHTVLNRLTRDWDLAERKDAANDSLNRSFYRGGGERLVAAVRQAISPCEQVSNASVKAAYDRLVAGIDDFAYHKGLKVEREKSLQKEAAH